jgi:hypothetical protein
VTLQELLGRINSDLSADVSQRTAGELRAMQAMGFTKEEAADALANIGNAVKLLNIQKT